MNELFVSVRRSFELQEFRHAEMIPQILMHDNIFDPLIFQQILLYYLGDPISPHIIDPILKHDPLN